VSIFYKNVNFNLSSKENENIITNKPIIHGKNDYIIIFGNYRIINALC